MNHEKLMELAIQQAEKAGKEDEVPIGAVLADRNGDVIAEARNQVIGLGDPCAHAEILAIRSGAKKLSNYRLLGTTLVVTIEPCIMCMGAIVHARVERLVFGANDPKWGAAGSLYDFASDSRLNHKVDVVSGVRADRCSDLMKEFFFMKRKVLHMSQSCHKNDKFE